MKPLTKEKSLAGSQVKRKSSRAELSDEIFNEEKEFTILKNKSLPLFNYNLNEAIKFQFTLDTSGTQIRPSFQWGDAVIKEHEFKEFKDDKVFILKDFDNQ